MKIFLKVTAMRNNWQENLRIFFIYRIPLLVTFFRMLLFFMPINSVKINYFRPLIGPICVYYWSLKRPYMFGYFSAFLVGLLIDVYSSSPMGINVLMMMTIIAINDWFSRYFPNTSFGMGWILFGSIVFLIIVLKWLILMIYFGHWLFLDEVVLNYLSTVMFYPFIAYINEWVQNNFLPQERINE